MKNNMIMKRLLALCLFTALITMMSCEDDDENNIGDPDPDQTMMEIINSETGESDGLDSLEKYLQNHPDLAAELEADGNATFFAPTNEAFSNLLELTGFSVSITDIDPEIVEAVLSYHLIPDTTVASADLEGGVILNTAYTDPETSTTQVITVNENGSLMSGAANSQIEVVEADLQASNGVVHKVDDVLIPPSIGEDLTPILGTLAGTVMLASEFTYLADMIDLADSDVPDGEEAVADILASSGTYTTFAPPNAVFESLAESEDPAEITDFINTTYDAATARAILLTHVTADGAMAIADFTDGGTVTALSGATLTITADETSATGFVVSSPGSANVPIIDADIAHTNGIAHVIGGILLPE